VKRSLFNLLAAASLGLCLCTSAVWLRSEAAAELLNYQNATLRNAEFVLSSRGDLALGIVWRSSPATAPYGLRYRTEATLNLPAQLRQYPRHGFVGPIGWGTWVRPGSTQWVLLFPLWLIVSVLAILPIVWVYRRTLGDRTNRTGICSTCGYDLRATPDRCPECGTAVTPTAQAPPPAASSAR